MSGALRDVAVRFREQRLRPPRLAREVVDHRLVGAHAVELQRPRGAAIVGREDHAVVTDGPSLALVDEVHGREIRAHGHRRLLPASCRRRPTRATCPRWPTATSFVPARATACMSDLARERRHRRRHVERIEERRCVRRRREHRAREAGSKDRLRRFIVASWKKIPRTNRLHGAKRDFARRSSRRLLSLADAGARQRLGRPLQLGQRIDVAHAVRHARGADHARTRPTRSRGTRSCRCSRRSTS